MAARYREQAHYELALEELAAAKALASFDFCSFGAYRQEQTKQIAASAQVRHPG